MTKTAATLTTLAETNGAPESLLYIGLCNSDINDWTTLRTILLQCGFIKVSANFVTLTPLGMETAAKIEAVIRK